jgi:capsule polysaccharide export protein KpsE/RkpR
MKPSLLILLACLLPLTLFADWPTDMLARLDAEQRASETAFSRGDFPALLKSQHRLAAIRQAAGNRRQVNALSPSAQSTYYQLLELRDEYAIRWLTVATHSLATARKDSDRMELKLLQEEQLTVLRDIDYLLNR